LSIRKEKIHSDFNDSPEEACQARVKRVSSILTAEISLNLSEELISESKKFKYCFLREPAQSFFWIHIQPSLQAAGNQQCCVKSQAHNLAVIR